MSGEILSADELEPARQFVGFVKRNGGTQGAQRNSAADLIERLLDSHEALRARLAEVEQALRFYADPANHAWPSPDQAWSNVDADNGDIARAVLDKGEPDG